MTARIRYGTNSHQGLSYLIFLGALAATTLIRPGVSQGSTVLAISGQACDPKPACRLGIYLERKNSEQKPDSASRDFLLEVTVQDTAFELDLGAINAGRLIVENEFYWCATEGIGQANGPDQRLKCDLLPAGRLVGGLKIASTTGEVDKDRLPKELAVRLIHSKSAGSQRTKGKPRVDPRETGPEADWIRVICPVVAREFSCTIPVGDYDAAFELAGFSPHYARALSIGSGLNRMDRISFYPGARVSGWVVSPEGHAVLESGLSLILMPRLGPSDADRRYALSLEGLALEASIGRDGRFFVEGAAPGSYVLQATGAGLCPTAKRLQVAPGASALELADPILLDRCLALDVMVDPPVDFWGGQWHLGLRQKQLLTGTLGKEVRVELGPDGWGRLDGLRSGSWSLKVKDSRGGVWRTEQIEMESLEQSLYVSVAGVEVRGSVRRGGEPISGTIVFGTRNRSPSIPLKVDEDGRFEGFLPREGNWPLEFDDGGRSYFPGTKRVELKEGQSYAEVLLDLSGARIEGVVLRGEEPAEGAFVYVFRKGPRRLEKETFARANDKGEFVIEGVRPGELQLQARLAGLSTEPKIVVVEDEEDIRDLKLVLHERNRIRGRVTAAHGMGLPGANVLAIGQDMAQLTTTGIDGSFSLELQAGVETANLAAWAAGYALELRTVAVSDTTNEVEITLHSGGAEVTFAVDPAKPGGQIIHNGSVVALARLLPVLLRSSGIFFVGEEVARLHVSPGTWTFCTGEVPVCRTETVVAGQRLGLLGEPE